MTEDHIPTDQPVTKKTRKPSPQERVKGKCSLTEFRAILDKVIGHPELFSDDQVRWAGEFLHASSQDPDGTIRITWSAATNNAAKKSRFTRTLRVTGETPQDDSIRHISREIALIEDEDLAIQRIEDLSKEFILRAAVLYGFKSDSAVGLKSAFANVVNDIRQMENIAASGGKKKPGRA